MNIEDMKLANCMLDGTPILVMSSDDRLYNLTAGLEAAKAKPASTTDELLKEKYRPELLTAAWSAAKTTPRLEGRVTFRPSVISPEKIVVVGLNYRKHALEAKMPIPEVPLLFGKFNNSLAAHGQEIRLPVDQDDYLDYEAELVIVIGRTARNVGENEALDYVCGYTVGNDLSARKLQMRTSQWMLGKTLDHFGPIGPFLVGRNAVPDPNNLKIECSVNGKTMQSSTTTDMIFSCKQVVSYISRYITLVPGDIIFTGTPEGVAGGYPAGKQPWLVPGDKVDVTIEGLGTLSNVMS
jgi:2-keto-4-pentenoate hydratase/2-oxohepta-3-ene-1,7-dioic acid hydratase in catechol pathway